MSYHGNYPKTKGEWWTLVDENWVDLVSLMHRWLGMNDMENIEGKLTEEPRAVEIERMKAKKDANLLKYLNGVWQNAPDKPWIHEIPGWGLLCDLCSEGYVLDE